MSTRLFIDVAKMAYLQHNTTNSRIDSTDNITTHETDNVFKTTDVKEVKQDRKRARQDIVISCPEKDIDKIEESFLSVESSVCSDENAEQLVEQSTTTAAKMYKNTGGDTKFEGFILNGIRQGILLFYFVLLNTLTCIFDFLIFVRRLWLSKNSKQIRCNF
jgi:hypothetical protein